MKKNDQRKCCVIQNRKPRENERKFLTILFNIKGNFFDINLF